MTADEPGSPQPDGPSGPARRSRRAGRTSQSYDFRTRFGDPLPTTERREGLHEPARRDQQVPGRERLTVRELMEQMGAGTSPSGPPPSGPSASGPPIGPHDDPRPARGPRPPLPPVPPTPGERIPRGGTPLPPTPGASTPPTGPADDADTEAIPSVTADGPAQAVAADEDRTRATTGTSVGERLRGHRRPLEPTPDLTGALARVKAERTKPVRRPRAQVKKAAAKNAGRVLVALACVLTLVGTGYVWNLQRAWNGSWNTTAAINPDDPNIRDKAAQYGDETYLIVGTDVRSGKNAKLGGGDTTLIEGARADTILLVNIPADRSRVVAVSWPRDLQVDRPDCHEWDYETGEYGAELPGANAVKLNGVYAEGGPKCLVKTLTQMSGLNINRFIAMDFEGFEKVVNQIGGVNVCSTVPLYDYEIGYVHRGGNRKLTGKRALNYVRARNVSVEGNGDYGRIKRQQVFMSSLLRSALSGDVLTNPAKLNRIVNTFIEYSTVDNVDTNSLIQLAESMQGVDAGRVTFLTIPTSGTTTDGANNEIPRTEDIDAIFNAIIDDKPLPGEKKEAAKPKDDDRASAPAPRAATATPGQTEATAQYPSNVTVRVLNGSGESGVATAVMNSLIGNQFTVPGVADASDKRTDTVVRYGAGEKDSAATLAAMIPGAKIQEDRNVKAGVEIILGSDFGGVSTMSSPPTPGSTITVGQLPKADTNSDLPNDLAVTNAADTTCS